MFRARGLNELSELRVCECPIRSCHVNQYERHPTILLIRRCRRGSTTSGKTRFVWRTLGSCGLSTGLQSHIPKVRDKRSAYPALGPAVVMSGPFILFFRLLFKRFRGFPFFSNFRCKNFDMGNIYIERGNKPTHSARTQTHPSTLPPVRAIESSTL
jgi:hypothetical protein